MFKRNEASCEATSISDVGGSLSQLDQLLMGSNRCSDLMDFVFSHLVTTAEQQFLFSMLPVTCETLAH